MTGLERLQKEMGDFVYYDNGDGSIKIGTYEGTADSVTIPAEVNGKPVTGISGWAFNGCNNLISVTFQGTITDISKGSFPGDLCDKYLTGGIGTYRRTNGSMEWTKQ